MSEQPQQQRGAEPGEVSEQPQQQRGAEELPAIVKVAAQLWLRAAAWGLSGSLRAASRLARAAADPDAAVALVEDVSIGLRRYAREFLGVEDIDARVRQLTPGSAAVPAPRGTSTDLVLRAQGAELLRQAADVQHEDGAHPAYARILGELAPDEARILRLLALEGPQPSVDVRALNLIGMGSQLVAPALNMVGAQAGVRHHDRVPAYLNNLHRLGLIWFSHEPLEDPLAYQVLEAQPDVLQAIKQTPRAKTARRSIRLTPFGSDFCDLCLPLDYEEVETLTAQQTS